MRVLTFVLRYSGKVSWAYLIFAVAILASVIAGLGSISLLAAINTAIGDREAAMGALAWIFFGLCILVPACRLLAGHLLQRLGIKFLQTMQYDLSRKILTAPLALVEKLGAARLLVALNEDLPSIVSAFSIFPALVLQSVVLTGCLVYLGMLSGEILLWAIGCFLLMSILAAVMVRLGIRYQKQGREAYDGLYDHFQAVSQGFKELKVYGRRRETFLEQVMTSAARKLRRKNLTATKLFAGGGTWITIVFFTLLGLVLFVFPESMEIDNQALRGYVLILIYMLVPLEALFGLMSTFSRAKVALRKTEELGIALDHQPTEAAALEAPQELPWGPLELDAASWSYNGEEGEHSFQLGPIDLDFGVGEIVFVIGGNGSGKTTLAKLLLGLYVATSGRLELDDNTIDETLLDSYRENFSAVFDDFFLFDELLGMEGPDLDERALSYVQKLQLDGKVEISEGHFSTLDLSQGQRKRLALVTAYLEDRPVYFFDEWAADQDPQFKRVFYYELLPELKSRGKTVFVISHDDRFFDVADRIVKLDFGQVDEDVRQQHQVETSHRSKYSQQNRRPGETARKQEV